MSRAAWYEARWDELERRERERREALELDENAETVSRRENGNLAVGNGLLAGGSRLRWYETPVCSRFEDDLEAVYGRNYDR